MALTETLQDLYSELEDKYYKFIDNLDKQGVPVYGFVDFFEENGLPSFPAAAAILALILVLVVFSLLAIFFPVAGLAETASLTVRVLDEQGAPVSSAELSVQAGDATLTQTTDTTGEAMFRVPAKQSLLVRGTHPIYGEADQRFAGITGSDEVTLHLVTEVGTQDHTIRFTRAGTSEIITAKLSADFTCSNPAAEYTAHKEVVLGMVTLQGVPDNCATMVVRVPGWEVAESPDLSDANPRVGLLSPQEGTGTIVVSVVDRETQVGLAERRVSLIRTNAANDASVREVVLTRTTGAGGTTRFEEVEADAYYVASVAGAPDYEDGESLPKALGPDESIRLNVALDKAVSKQIKLRVLDTETGNPVAGARVMLTVSTVTIYEKTTDAEGLATFDVPRSYTAQVEATGFLTFRGEVGPAEEVRDILLTPLGAPQDTGILVHLVDSFGKPVEMASVQLFQTVRTGSAEPVGGARTTGASGKTAFIGILPGTYYVSAVKRPFKPVTSENITVVSGQQVEARVPMFIGQGAILVRVTDPEGEPVAGARVRGFDIFTGLPVGELSTDFEGRADFSVRLDKLVYFVIDFPGFLPYTTSPVAPRVATAEEVLVELVPEGARLEAKLQQLTYQGEEVSNNALARGRSYTAWLQLIVPQETEASVRGLFLRTGEFRGADTHLLADDILSIKATASSADEEHRGTSYSPPRGGVADLSARTAKEAKWTELLWSRSKEGQPDWGVFEAQAQIQVRKEAVDGDEAVISYRGFLGGEGWSRDPVDDVLGGFENTSEKEGLYAVTHDAFYSIGASSLCIQGWCRSFELEDRATNQRTFIVDAFPGQFGNTYRLHFTLNRQRTGGADNVALIFEDIGRGLRLGRYSLTTGDGRALSGDAAGFLLTEQVGRMTQGSTVFGWVEFEIVQEGVSILNVRAESAGAQLLSHDLTVEVAPAREMSLHVVPAEIIPMIENELIARVEEPGSEGEEPVPLARAAIDARLDGVAVATGLTDNDGLFPFRLPAPTPGSELKVRATKPGYRPAEQTFATEQGVLALTPPELGVDLQADVHEEGSAGLQARNITAVPLTLAQVAVTGDFEGLVNITNAGAYTSLPIEAGAVQELAVQFELTQAGRNAAVSKTFNASVELIAESEELATRWTHSVPLTLRVLLGGEVDAPNCLMVTPGTWAISTQNSSRSLEVTIQNTCTSENQPVNLRALTAHVEWGEGSTAGSFLLTSNDLDITTPRQLGVAPAAPAEIADILPGGFQGTALLTFEPEESAVSGAFTPSIRFGASHPAEGGVEHFEAVVNTTLTISLLSECVKIHKQEEMEIRTCGANTGFAYFQDNFGRDPSLQAYGSPAFVNYSAIPTTPGLTEGVTGPFTSIPPPGVTSPIAAPNQPVPLINPLDPAAQAEGFRPVYPFSYIDRPLPPDYAFAAEPLPPPAPFAQPTAFAPPEADTSFACSDGGQFEIENACPDPVEIELDPDTSLRVEEKAFVLAPEETRSVNVIPGVRTGRYSVDVLGRLAGGDEAFTLLDTVRARVLRLEDITEECRPYVSPTTFRVPFFGYESVSGKIFNPCHNLGYRLMPLTGQEFVCFTIESGGRSLGACPLVEAAFSSEPRVIQNTQDPDDALEVMDFRLQYNTDIVQQWPGFVEGSPEEQIGNLRFSLGRLFNSVESPGVLNIPMRTPFTQGVSVVPRNVHFVDPFQWIGALSVLMKDGSPVLRPSECVNIDALDVLAQHGPLSDNDFINDKFDWKPAPPRYEYVMPMPRNNADVQSGVFCGEVDRISSMSQVRWRDPDSGVVLAYRIVQNNHHILLSVDRSEMVTACASINTFNPIRVRRFFHQAGEEEVRLPVRLQVLNNGIEQYTPGCENVFIEGAAAVGSLAACTETGPVAAEKFAFNRLLFSWDSGAVGTDTCDPEGGGYFCDAEQFGLALMAQYRAAADSVDRLNEVTQTSERIKGVIEKVGKRLGLEAQLQEPGGLYVVATDQIEVFDDVRGGFGTSTLTGTSDLFFLGGEIGGNATLLEAPPHGCNHHALAEKLAGVAQADAAVLREDARKNILLAALDEIRVDVHGCYGDDFDETNIVALINEQADLALSGEPSRPVWEAMKSEGGPIEWSPRLRKYVMAFHEYRAMHDQLLGQVREDNPNQRLNYGIRLWRVKEPKAAWISFLDKFYRNVRFVVGVKNQRGLFEPTKQHVRDQGLNLIDVRFDEGVRHAYLIGDNYSSQFWQDFWTRHRDELNARAGKTFLGLFPKGIDIEPDIFYNYNGRAFLHPAKGTKIETGEFAYQIMPIVNVKAGLGDVLASPQGESFTLNGFKVRLGGVRSVKDISTDWARNSLLYVPFDPLQGEDGRNYGTGFRNLSFSSILGGNATNPPSYIVYDSEGSFIPLSNGRSTFLNLTPRYLGSFADTQGGRVMEVNLNARTLDYSPSYPTRLMLSWSTAKGNEVYYDIKPSSRLGNTRTLVSWFFGNRKVTDQYGEQNRASFCEQWQGGSRRLARARLDESGAWNGVLFVPEQGGDLVLELFCAKELTNVESHPYAGTGGVATASRNSIQRIPIANQGALTPSLKFYAQGVALGEICVSEATGRRLVLSWNPEWETGQATAFGGGSAFSEPGFFSELENLPSAPAPIFPEVPQAPAGPIAPEEEPPPEAPAEAPPAEPAAPEPQRIDLLDGVFNPGTITVPVGTEVTWHMLDDAPHTVTAFELPEGADPLDSGTLEKDGTYPYTFEVPGTYRYRSEEAPESTVGSVVVE